MQADYDTARAAGVSVITRFAYVQGGAWPYEPPYGDAPLDVVLAHIQQLGPILRANSDVIPVVQNGLIGLWGEGYYTDHFVADPANPGVVTDADWAKRSAVTEALLDELPADRGVQVRTMLSKQKLLGVPAAASSAVTAEDAYSDSAVARVGHHNDCLLAAPDDWGTFLSDPITLDQEYLAADSLYVPVGGETCNVNPPRSEWDSASAELERYHYSYLNRDYNQDVLNSWGEAGLEETAQRLGYRFVMTSSTVTPQADGSATVSVDVRNDGWAAPYTPRNAVLTLDARQRFGYRAAVRLERRRPLLAAGNHDDAVRDARRGARRQLRACARAAFGRRADGRRLTLCRADGQRRNVERGCRKQRAGAGRGRRLGRGAGVVPTVGSAAGSAAPTLPTGAGASGATLASTGQALNPAGLVATGAAALAVLALGGVLIAARRRA